MAIAKQMDIRSNIKKYFDMAYDGEAVFVPRIANRNVVIISETEYNFLTQTKRVSSYASLLTSVAKSNASGAGGMKSVNKEKLKIIQGFKNNWNGNGAPSFPESLITKVSSIVDRLVIQPELFPTALQTIQLEFDNSAKDHMEIEIGTGDVAEIYVIGENGDEINESIEIDLNDLSGLNERIMSFYG